MKRIGDIVSSTVEIELFVPHYHVVKVGDKGQITNIHEDVKVYRNGDSLVSAPYLVQYDGARAWVGEDEVEDV